MSAAPPLAQPASTSTMGMPVMPSRLSTLWPGRHPAVGRAAEGGLEPALADAGLAQRGPHGDHAHVGGRDAVEAPEGVQADAGDVDVAAHGDAGSAGAKA